MFERRVISCKLYPSVAQYALLLQKKALLKDLWNAALEERIGAWRLARKSISVGAQKKAIKTIRLDVPGWLGLVHTHEAQSVLERLDRAFEAFYRRCKAGQTPGFPRFRSLDRFSGWGYLEHRNGFRVDLRADGKHGHVRLFGIGRMRIRGKARMTGRICKADVIHTARGWFLSVVIETSQAMRPKATGGAMAYDWGIADYASMACEDGNFRTVANPRHLNRELEVLKSRARELSKQARRRAIAGGALRKARRALAKAFAALAARRKDFLHKLSAQLVARHDLIATEELAVCNMSGSARGTLEEPGRNVAQKAGLNRAILDGAPATFLNMVRYKAAEVGGELLIANTRKLKPSQRCPCCGDVAKKSLDVRIHDCSCGARLGRDHAAALVVLHWALDQSGRARPPLPLSQSPGRDGRASDCRQAA
jgi:putative transposase